MKELSIEQKAKRYDEIIKKTNKMHNENCEACQMCIEELIPELAESEDERIKEICLYTVKNYFSEHYKDWDNVKGFSKNDIIAWLEKQGEQKSFARYKVGDTIYYNSFGRLVSFVIANIVEDGTDNPMYEDKDGNSVFQNDIVKQKPADKVEPKFNVGDKIQYLKGCGTIMTIEKIKNGEYIFANKMGHTSIEDGNKWYLVEQTPVWSEDDEKHMYTISSILEDRKNQQTEVGIKILDKEIDWFKSLKDRVQPKQEWKQENIEELSDFENVMMHIGNSFFGQYAGLDPNDTNTIKEQANILLELVPKQEWNKEDEERLKNIISVLDVQVCWDGATGKKGNPYQKEIDWLKSLRPQNKWKPSVEQMIELRRVINRCSYDIKPLAEIEKQLKKLREE